MGAHEAAFRLRNIMPTLDAEEVWRLHRWLQWRGHAARANGNSALLARVAKLQSMFGAGSGKIEQPPNPRGFGSARTTPKLAHSA